MRYFTDAMFAWCFMKITMLIGLLTTVEDRYGLYNAVRVVTKEIIIGRSR
jgi:hypothetical protein